MHEDIVGSKRAPGQLQKVYTKLKAINHELVSHVMLDGLVKSWVFQRYNAVFLKER